MKPSDNHKNRCKHHENGWNICLIKRYITNFMELLTILKETL